MTAPTLSEPRPDDEGRETLIARVAKLRHRVGAGGSCRCEDCRAIKQVVALAREAVAMKKSRRALTPHPAPLGATAQPDPRCPDEECSLCAPDQPCRPACPVCHPRVGATDEGREAVVELEIYNLSTASRAAGEHYARHQGEESSYWTARIEKAKAALRRAALQATP